MTDRATARLHGPIKWFGGKGAMIAKLQRIVPPGGRPYCEPFCGGASLFFAREPAPVEVINDTDGDLVNFYRCMQDRESFERLRHRIMWTPYSRAEYLRAFDVLRSPNAPNEDRAWATFVARNQGMSGFGGERKKYWGRTFTSASGMAHTVSSWLMRLSMLDAYHWRLMQVQIDQIDGIEAIKYWDSDDAVFYVDPPYPSSTWSVASGGSCYAELLTDSQHESLVSTLISVRGAAVVSTYPNGLYDRLEAAGWKRTDFHTACKAAVKIRNSKLIGAGSLKKHVPRVEVVYANPRAVELMRAVRSNDGGNEPNARLLRDAGSQPLFGN